MIAMNKHTQAAKNQSCVRCGIEDGTIVLAHYTGPMAHKVGKGKGLKGHDLAGAWLCRVCHDLLDGRTPSEWTPEERALELAVLSLQTVCIRYEQGDLSK